MASPTVSSVSHSSAERGLPSAQVSMFCCSCFMLDMPERTIVICGTDCRKRNAHAGTDSSGRNLARRFACSLGSVAKRPPRKGSITHMGMLRCFRRSTFSKAFWKRQSM